MSEELFEMVEDSKAVAKKPAMGIGRSVIVKCLDEAVRDLGLSISWEVYLCEHVYWKYPLTHEKFREVYDKVSRGMIGAKLWMIMPIVGVYFGRFIANWDDNFWTPDCLSSPRVATVVVEKKMSWLWSEIIDEETNEPVGIHYHAAYLWDLLKSGSDIRMIIMYDEEDANLACCSRKFYVRKTSSEKAQEVLVIAQKMVEMKKR